jgi:hypothetical protein
LGFAYFVLGLLESARTKVVVVDERVADAVTSAGNDADAERANRAYQLRCDLTNAGVYPVYRLFLRDVNKELPHFVSPQRGGVPLRETEGIDEEQQEAQEIEMAFGIPRDEGLRLQETDALNVWDSDGSLIDASISHRQPDIVVIHHGLIEHLLEKDIWISGKENSGRTPHLKRFFRLVPRIVITSGRGKNQDNHGDLEGLPFIDFSVIRDYTYTEMSKFHLTRALLSAIGSH